MSKGLGSFNQVSWYGVGDADECWIIATYWALVASGVMKRDDLPTIKEFREAAGKPDRPGPTGGNNANLLLGLKTLGIPAETDLFSGGIEAFTHLLQRGWIASLSVSSAALPPYLQFGFKGLHQVAVYYQQGKFYVMNPLAQEGSPLLQISKHALIRAAGGYLGDGNFHALFVRAEPKHHKKASPTTGKTAPRTPSEPAMTTAFIDPWASARSYRERHRKRGLENILG